MNHGFQRRAKTHPANAPPKCAQLPLPLHWVLKFSDSHASCQLSEVLCSKLSKVRTEWLSLFGPSNSVDLQMAVAVHRSARRL